MSYGRACFLPLLSIALFVSTATCSGESDNDKQTADRRTADGRIVHPIDDKLPHKEVDPVVVNREDRCASDKEYVTQVREAVEQQNTGRRLDLNLPAHNHVEVASLDENTLLVLNTKPRANALWQYDLRKDRAIKVAGRGKGPGELDFATDLAMQGDTVYVAQSSMQIDAFFCGSGPCQYERTIHTGFQLRNLASRADGKFVAMGLLPLQKDRAELEALEGALQVLTPKGEVIESFGETYDTDAWLIKSYYKRGANVDYGKGTNTYALSRKSLPYLYLYGKSGSIEKVYKIEYYEENITNYNPETKRRGTPDQDRFSRILRIKILESGPLFLTSETVLRESPKTEDVETHTVFDYYLINSVNECLIDSEDKITISGGEIILTNEHILRIQEGSMYYINKY